ncbi:hypothetical protein TSUD_161460 [Trifolium subterraneum]|uniref:Uncharacterized protein n=1 Tax=Trifolium subterraneum TaxID=3900 RepID=A0A2Z6MUU5_TRISU|nr:hypothetical protein TSUD_161460 [Trifolium subterraneum]
MLIIPMSSVTGCRGDADSVEVLDLNVEHKMVPTKKSFAYWERRRSVRLGGETVRSSRLFTSAMSVFGPLDLTNRVLWIKATVQMQVAPLRFVQTLQTPYSLNFFQLPQLFPAFKLLDFKLSLLDFIVFAVYQTTSVMAEEQAPASPSNVDGDDYAWEADEPRTTISKFPLNGGDGMFRTVQRPPADEWKACIPNTNRRICSKFQWGSFPMAFEMTAAYLGFLPTIPLFFHAFHLQRSKPKGDAANKFGSVSLKQSTKLFEMFLESVRGFKDSYFFIKPLNSVSWQSIIYRGSAKDATGAPLVGPDGRPIMEDYSCFPLSWRKSHYMKPASDFIYSTEELTVEELSNYEQMKVFVGSFPRKYYEDEEGNPILDDMGVPLTKKTFIDTKGLLACKSATEMEACFQGMSTVAAKLRNTVVVDLDDAVVNVEGQPRPAKVARVEQVNASATGRVSPSSPKFVFPPAIGSPKLVRKSPVALSDAELAIMNDMGPEALKNEIADAMVAAFKMMEISSFLNGRECKYLEERDNAKEEAALLRQSLEQAKVNHAAYKDRYKLQAGLVTQLTEKEKEAARLVEEKAVLEGQIKDLTSEKETLEGKVRDLESMPCSSGTAPDVDELVVDPNGEYKGFTRAALVSRIFELKGQQLDVAESSFDNVVAQLEVLNPGVELVVAGASELKEVQDGAIVSPSPDEEDRVCLFS